ncbi:uncharacterized protein BDZ99DRAFT_495991 [Mytilinidion resinicola]|uniref:Tat pathway signal sequence n=1 Tax=Mytilinidion resinicola TaxID=574789 RepID=A0A6A6YV55_9PEZI|nr:uncharacterized protein BDZ99DRAFT_495991 [Mytilinidion resinicola]KAF2812836.1 hypothetical protein BDZ99DRAFT_495991 [Mytilinidion resinicola]
MDSTSYKPLQDNRESEDQHSDDEKFWEEAQIRPRSLWRQKWLIGAIILPWCLLLLESVFIADQGAGWNCSSCPPSSQLLYSPAQDAVHYEIKKFNHGFNDDISPLQGPPSDERDKLWEDLYNFGMSAIPKSQATLLPNRTGPIPGLDGQYLVELDVFHQLHCLNNIRMSRYPDRYTTISHNGIPHDFADSHVEHCIDSIRQSLMCHSDISPLVWQWSEEQNAMRMHGDVVHTCRNFDAIREWARARRPEVALDPFERAGGGGAGGG